MAESDKMDIEAIMRQLPHRYPFLLVDRVMECVPGKHIHALKNVTFNEPYFQGHFPHRPVMPGVIIIEAMAQAAGILAFKTVGIVPDTNTRFYFVAIDNARFRKPVEPGDQLVFKVTLKRAFKGITDLPKSTGRRWLRQKSWWLRRPRCRSSKERRDDRPARGDIAAGADSGGRRNRPVHHHRCGRRDRAGHLDRAARRYQRAHAHRCRQ
jgi:3-hydroxyacyl-[acyl-carrier-protein] dehydratase